MKKIYSIPQATARNGVSQWLPNREAGAAE
jgi:hypothetical protein